MNTGTLAQRLDIRRRHILQAQAVARRIQQTLERRGVQPAFRAFQLTRYAGILMLIAELDTPRLERLERYTSPDLLHQISTNLEGMKVYVSNTTGLRYVVPLSKPRGLPRRIPLPGDVPVGRAALGMAYTGKRISRPWGDLGHMLVAGMTGSGKSMFLRLLVWQALRDGMHLLLSDIDQATFPMLAEHPALLAPLATMPEDAHALIRRALGECDHRAALYRKMPGYPEDLEEYNRLAVKAGREPLPRVLLLLDEFSATLKALGGGKSAASSLLASIGFRGRKFGVTVVFAAHEFTKEEVGLLRDQVRTVVMFRVQNPTMAKRLGCEGAARISAGRPGLAVTNRWGPMQAYLLEKSRLVQAGGSGGGGAALTPAERLLFMQAIRNGGTMSRSQVQQWSNATEWQARKWLQQWALRGWVRKDPEHRNAFVTTPKIRDLLSRSPASPTASSSLQQAGMPLQVPSSCSPTAV